MVNTLETITMEIFRARLRGMMLEAEALRPAPIRVQDDVGDTLDNIMALIRSAFAQVYPAYRINNMATDQGVDINEFNTRDMTRVLGSIVGTDVFLAEPWLKPQLGMFIKANVDLITSIPTQALSQVETTVMSSVRIGARVEELAKEIQGRFDVSKARAELIARDQTSKFNGELTKLRQTEAGINKYRWATSNDERVRESHQALEGRVFSWDDPPSVGHPGDDYQCRCVAIPIFEE